MTPQNRPQKAPSNDLAHCRAALSSFERILRTARELRAEDSAAGMDLRERIAWAAVIQDCERMVAEARRRLRQAQRRAKGVRHGR